MKKKVISMIVLAILSVSLVACGNDVSKDDSNRDKVNVGSAQQDESDTTENGESDTKESEKEKEIYSNPDAIPELTDEQGIVYTVNDEKTAYTADLTNMTSTEIVIKDMIDGLPVTKIDTTPIDIADREFRNTITSIKIPDTVEELGTYALCLCGGVTEITIPDGVTVIPEGTFKECRALTTVNLPDSLIEISRFPFQSCSLASIEIPNGVEKIGYMGLAYCNRLTEIVLPDSVTEIGGLAFVGCMAVTSITIPDNVTKIGEKAFSTCSNLVSATIPESVTEIGENIFTGCDKLQTVYINAGSYAEEYIKTNYPDITIEYK